MSLYASIDPMIRAWAEANALKLFDSFAEQEARFCYTSSQKGECCQIWIEPPQNNTVTVHAGTIETLGDREMHQKWTVPPAELNQVLETALRTVRVWMDSAAKI